jgi:hypothetical protein
MKEERFKTFTIEDRPYRFDRYLFLGGVIFLLLITLGVLFLNGFDKSEHIYINCPKTSVTACQNPFFQDEQYCGVNGKLPYIICGTPTFIQGFSWGEKPSWIVLNFGAIAIILMIGIILLNHFLYNTGKRYQNT